ncbi:hypothetical protein [Arthrobacter cryoconiti]|uniref:Uncharacterized protein n=1 Tax=Arthrobacter cryoconiti TaxID=748907 RepID=A0ABV8R429_9MICC|nr:hypothetical protein [Arthrobacter cryoconiti]MCC9069125.1 hypothetical protein [Arthrobacter cryoconiti]
MQSDHGHSTPDANGNDEAVWADLVSRLQEPSDAFMDGTLGGDPLETGMAPEQKTVNDFDPLGVWRKQSEPAPTEPSFEELSFKGERTSQKNTESAIGQSPDSRGPRDYHADEFEEDFVPPEPPSLAGVEPIIMLSWIGAVGGPLFLVVAAIFWRGIPFLAVIGVIMAFLAGTGYLLFKLPHSRENDDGDGAVV